MDTTAAAARLGVPADEVIAVDDTPAGVRITTADGMSYIDLAVPDAAGNTGLVFAAAPFDGYQGSFPVFHPGDAPAELADAPVDDESADAAPVDDEDDASWVPRRCVAREGPEHARLDELCGESVARGTAFCEHCSPGRFGTPK